MQNLNRNNNRAVSLSNQEELAYLENLNKLAKDIASLYKASQSWFWRIIVIIVSLATVVSAVFEVFGYFRS